MTRHQKTTVLIGAALVLLGGAGIAVRAVLKKHVRIASSDRVWRLAYDVDVESGAQEGRLVVSLPLDTEQARVFRRTVTHPGLSSQIVRSRGSREQSLVILFSPGDGHYVRCEFDIHVSPSAKWTTAAGSVPPTPDLLAQYQRPERAIQSDNPKVLSMLAAVRKGAPDRMAILERIREHCSSQIAYGDGSGAQDALAVLERGSGNSVGGARAMVALCRAAKLPARLVTGFELYESSDLAPRTWAEVYLGESWRAFDPESGTGPRLPSSFVPVRIGGIRIVRTAGGRASSAAFSVEAGPAPEGIVGAAGEHPGEILDLTRFSLATQHTLSLLLILPLGALVTAFFRNVIGLKTFGIFTPALIALSFIFADWITGLGIFVAVLILGVIGRGVFDRLKLLMVARLGLVMTLVVGLSALLVSIMDFLGLSTSTETVLLPMVIVTLMVERAYIITEEDGSRVTAKLLAGTLALAAVCYLLMRWEFLTSFVVAFPEVHFVTAGLLVWIGRYSGYRLSELWRFHDLAESIPPQGGGKP